MYFGLSWSCPHEWGVRRTVGKGVHICWCLSQDLTKALRAKLKPVCSPAPQEIKQSERLCCSHTSCPREMKQSERLRCLQTSSVPHVAWPKRKKKKSRASFPHGLHKLVAVRLSIFSHLQIFLRYQIDKMPAEEAEAERKGLAVGWWRRWWWLEIKS